MHDKRASLTDVIRSTHTTHMQSVVDQTSNSTTIVGMQMGLIDAGYRPMLELNNVIVNIILNKYRTRLLIRIKLLLFHSS